MKKHLKHIITEMCKRVDVKYEDINFKALLDALCEEDSHVWHADVYKYWSKKGYIEYETK